MITLSEQQLINLIQPDLPIRAYPQRQLLPNLRQQFPRETFTTKTELEIRSVMDMRDEGGVICEVIPTGFDTKKAKAVVLCSITHLRIKKGEPHCAQIVRYQVKRMKKLARQDPFH